MKVLVCGGRDYANQRLVDEVLDDVHAIHRITLVIHGAARGADALADSWAKRRAVGCRPFPADWAKHGKAAGPLRNQQMLEEGHPDLVCAFPGGSGTEDMKRRARAAGIKVVEFWDEPGQSG